MATERPGGPGGTAGMLSLDELRKEAEAGTIDTVVTAFTDMQGRLFGKRIQVEYFLDEVVEHGVEGCNYLLALDMEMEPVPGYEMANWENGYGDFGIVPDMATLRADPLARPHRAGALRRRRARRLPGRRLAAPGADRPVRARPRDGLHADVRLRARVLPLQGELRRGPREGLQRTSRRRSPTSSTTTSSRRRWTSSTSAPIRRGMHAAGIPIEFSKGEAWYGQHEVNTRYADAVTSADRHTIYKNGVKEIAFLNGISATFMAKPSEKDIGSSCHVHSSLVDDGRQERLRRRRRGDRRLPPLPRRPARPHPGAGAVRRALGQLLQALRGRELGADLDLLGPRQPHLRLPHRRPRAVAPGRVPDPRRRRQPLPRLRGAARRRPRRDRERDRSRPGAEGQRLRGRRGRALPVHAARGGGALGGKRLRPSGVRRGGPASTTSTTAAPSSGSSTRSSPTTSAGACSSAADPRPSRLARA